MTGMLYWLLYNTPKEQTGDNMSVWAVIMIIGIGLAVLVAFFIELCRQVNQIHSKVFKDEDDHGQR